MRRTLSYATFGLGAALAFLLIGTVRLGMRNQAPTHDSIKLVVVSSSGQRLTTLFDGIPPDPRYSVKDILAKRRSLPRCGDTKPGTLRGAYDKATSFFQNQFVGSTVYASCLITFCGGSGWVDYIDSCNTASGIFQDQTHCGSAPECGCEILTC